MQAELQAIFEAIVEGDMGGAPRRVEAALAAGLAPETILNEGMIAAMSAVGKLFEEGEYFVPEMLVSARAMQASLAVLKPLLVETGVQPVGTVVIGTVQGDLHDIGKNLVAMMLEGAGFAVVDLGVNVDAGRYVAAVTEHGAQLVAMSALLSTTMPRMKSTVEALRAGPAGGRIKIMVGGAPVTASYAQAIGADGYAPDASQAVTLAKSLVGAAAEE